MSKARDLADSAQEINILDGKSFLDEDNLASNSATGIASQQSIKAYVDGITTTNITSTGALNSGSITSGFGNINNGSSTITTTGAITGGSFVIGSADINENDLESIDGITAGTVAASKAVVVNANKDITGFRNLTATGTINGTLSGAIASTTTATTQAESDDSTKVATTAYVVDKITTLIGGAPSTLNDLNELAAAINDDANYNSTLTTALGTKLPKAGGTMTGDVLYNDNIKAKFGAGSDLQIYHDGSQSFIKEGGTGELFIQGDTDVRITNSAGSEFKANFITNGPVDLYYDNSKKLATTSTGIDVTGTVTADDILLQDTNSPSITLTDTTNTVTTLIQSGNSSSTIGTTTSHGLNFVTNNADRMFITSSGNVGIGTSSPQAELHVHDPVGHAKIRLSGAASDADTFEIYQGITGVTNGGLTIRDVEATADRLVINSTGNVGIGTSSPDFKLQVSGATTQIGIESTSTSQNASLYYTANGANQWEVGVNITAGLDYEIFDRVNNTPRFVVTHAGNVLVGNTDVSPYTRTSGNGIALGDGLISSAQSGGNAAIFNRMTSDGSIVGFRKGGVAVGSAGVVGGNDLYIAGGATGIRLDSDVGKIYPTDGNGAVSNGTVDIGETNYKFKDGHFSGNLYGNGSNLTGVSPPTAYNAVGTYVWGYTADTGYVEGDTKGSGIFPAGFIDTARTSANAGFQHGNPSYMTRGGTACSGTWRAMGRSNSDSSYQRPRPTLWVRIS